MEIKRDLLLKRLIDLRHNGMIKVGHRYEKMRQVVSSIQFVY